MGNLNPDLLRKALNQVQRKSFEAFLRGAFYEMHKFDINWNWHHEVICDALFGIQTSEDKRLIINVPPRSLKSFICNIAWPAWLMGQNPRIKIISISYAQDLSNNFARDQRELMSSTWYRQIFPFTKLNPKKSSEEEFKTTEGGFRLSTSTGDILTGRGADVIIIDDPIKPDEAFSETQRKNCIRWIEGTLMTRLDNKHTGIMVMIMQRLADIESGKIDVVVVYKVDRLSRALSDFAKMVEVFDKHGVSFVSVTQQFNTTTSMGRLTLNVLLSFAQFEREVTGERIRDKFAASKKKGMWMGGPQPLGYDVVDRKLVINAAEAEIIKLIFEYCAGKPKGEPLWQILDQLRAKNYKNKSYTSRKGNNIISKDFGFSQIYKILSNPIYNGKIRHKEQIHEGEHQAIINDELWNKVRGRISKQDFARNPNKKAEQPKLAGKIFDYLGNRLSATYSYKHSPAGRYKMRYYVNREISKQGKSASEFKRIRAEHIDNIVLAEISGIIEVLTSAISISHNNELSSIILRPLNDLLSDPAQLVSKVVLFPQYMELLLSLDTQGKPLSEDSLSVIKNILSSYKADITASPESAIVVKLNIKAQYKRFNGQMHIMTENNVAASEAEASYFQPNDKTFAMIAKSFYWNKQIKNGTSKGNKEISIQNSHSPAYIKRALRQRFLSPRIIERITSNTEPSQITAEELINLHHWSWEMQDRHLSLT